MRRIPIKPRADWKRKVEDLGLIFHTTEQSFYWNESAYYEFTMREIEEIERATAELQQMCLQAGQHIIDYNLFEELRIPPAAIPLIKQAWEQEPPSIYGRFDLAYDGSGPPKLLEYNADTPTALLEASVIQWYWLKDVFPKADQFNSIHEKLVTQWHDIKPWLKGDTLYFCHEDNDEDIITVSYLRECAHQAGIERTSFIYMSEIGWNEETGEFRDLEENRMVDVFKLYPWEWLLDDKFGEYLLKTYPGMQWIEPIWKMMWSNKGLLAILWSMYPGHPYLLEAHTVSPREMDYYVKKPLLSREGANVTVKTRFGDMVTGGSYGAEGYVYQAIAPIPEFDGNYPVIGSWVVTDNEPAGIGIRESDSLVTDNMSRFVPHIISGY